MCGRFPRVYGQRGVVAGQRFHGVGVELEQGRPPVGLRPSRGRVDGESKVEACKHLLHVATDSFKRAAAFGVRHRKPRGDGERAFVAVDHLRVPAAALI